MSKDIRKWSDGRYTLMFDEHTFFVWDNEKDDRMTALNVTKRLNEQQATIQRMKHSLNTIYKAFEKHYGYDMRNAVWLIDELNDEIVDELYIAETDSKNRKEASMYWKKKVDEQQATIQSLKSDKAIAEDYANIFEKENVKLRKQIGEQQATIQELERKLKKFEKIGENQLKQIIVLQDELNECRARPTLATDERGVVKVEYR